MTNSQAIRAEARDLAENKNIDVQDRIDSLTELIDVFNTLVDELREEHHG